MRPQDIEKFIKDFELEQSKQNSCSSIVSPSEKKTQCNLSKWFSTKHFNNSVKEIADKIPYLGNLSKESDLVIIDNFLPENVANALQTYLKVLPETEWQLSTSESDAKMHNYSQGSGSTEHSFAASEGIVIDSSDFQKFYYNKQSTIMEKFLSILSSSLQIAKTKDNKDQRQQLNNKKIFYTFQCGRYKSGHFIEPHDDKALEIFEGENYNRDFAVVLHLSESWDMDYGGLFLDMEAVPSRPVVPKFNTLVMFKVPRLHQVTPITKNCAHVRYSIFGWSLTAASSAAAEIPNKHYNHSSSSRNSHPSDVDRSVNKRKFNNVEHTRFCEL